MGYTDEVRAQKDRLFVWSPVAFGAGIAAYFSLPSEPPGWAGAAALAACLVPAIFQYRHHHDSAARFCAFIATIGLALAALGFAAAQGGTAWHGTPVLQGAKNPVRLSGTIESVENMGARGSRVILTNLSIEGVTPSQTPRKARVTFRKDEGLKAGLRIETLASLDAPSRAVAPGAYDFRRHFFFEGIGAVGFSFTAATIAEGGQDSPFFEETRTRINDRVHEESGKAASGIMTALITGERGAIDEADNEAMRQSGLYHLLSISGAHVTMVAGILFFCVRLILAAVPFLALRYPIKKIAAVAALAGAVFYVFLAGAEVPAQRALLMTGLIMIAIMLDRSPFSLRLIAFAAIAVLAFAPHALVGVSFQMSFAAVAALICFFEWIRPWWMTWYARGSFLRKAFMGLAAVLLTSVIAGAVTGLFSLYHFQSFAVYGVLANMLAVPLTAFVIMPAAVAAMILMPFGVSALALTVMEWGVVWMLSVAHWTAGLEGAVVHVAQWPFATFLCLCTGLVLFLLWQGWRGKAVAVFFILAGIIFAAFAEQPQIRIAEDGKTIAVRQGEEWFASSGRADRFAVENWMRLAGREGERPKLFSDKGSPVLCDSAGCRAEIGGHKIAVPENPRAFAEDCFWADIIISRAPVKKWKCTGPGLVIDRYDMIDSGGMAVYFEKWVRVRSVSEEIGHRPWR